MGVIVSIIVVIGGMLLYEFYDTRKWQLITSKVRNDIVFKNKNKEYGAYALRRDYDSNMLFILAGVILSTGFAFGAYRMINSSGKIVAVPKIDVDTTITVDLKEKEDLKLPDLPEIKKDEPVTRESVANNIPVIVDFSTNDSVPTQDMMVNQNVSTVTRQGDGELDPFQIIDGNGDGPNVVTEIDSSETDKIIVGLSEEARFKEGSVQGWIARKVVYPQAELEIGNQGKVVLEFVIEKDGSVSNLRVAESASKDFDDEAKRVGRLMPNWIPGKLNGKAVRSRVRIPINFKLEER